MRYFIIHALILLCAAGAYAQPGIQPNGLRQLTIKDNDLDSIIAYRINRNTAAQSTMNSADAKARMNLTNYKERVLNSLKSGRYLPSQPSVDANMQILFWHSTGKTDTLRTGNMMNVMLNREVFNVPANRRLTDLLDSLFNAASR